MKRMLVFFVVAAAFATGSLWADEGSFEPPKKPVVDPLKEQFIYAEKKLEEFKAHKEKVPTLEQREAAAIRAKGLTEKYQLDGKKGGSP